MDQKDEVEKNEMDNLLAWLSSEPEKAAALYLELYRKLILMFRFFNEPEDLAGEVIKRTLNNIKKGKVIYNGKAEHYISRIAYFVKKEQIRKKIEFQLDDTINDPPASLRESDFPEDLYQIIEKCLCELALDERAIFLDYSFPPDDLPEKEHRQNVAKKRNITIKHLRVMIYRIKSKLRACAKKKREE